MLTSGYLNYLVQGPGKHIVTVIIIGNTYYRVLLCAWPCDLCFIDLII